MDLERLEKQIRFILEIDKLKHIVRQTLLLDGSRQENSSEHSWHLAVMAIFLSEYAKEKDLDVFRVMKMAVIHDLVEIDAGDTYCYDEKGNSGKLQREQAAADRIFSILPEDQTRELRSLWDEFEARETPEARFAAALDRLQPLLHNFNTDGIMWRRHGVKSEQVLSRNRPMAEGAPELWDYALHFITEAIEKGMLQK